MYLTVRECRRYAPLFIFVLCLSVSRTTAQDVKTLERRITALENRVELLENRVNLITGEKPAQAKASAQPAQASVKKALDIPLKVRLFQKKFIKAEEWEDSGQFGFLLEFRNNGEKDITGLEGEIIIMDYSGDPLMSFGIDIVKRIDSGDNNTWYGGINYDSKDKNHRKIRSMSAVDLKVAMKVRRVEYSDGTVKEAGK